MFTPTEDQLRDAKAHAARAAPLESCGLIFNGDYHPVKNTATKPGWFSMDTREVHNLRQCGNVTAVVHSHVYHPPIASEADRSNCEKNGLPWLIVSHPMGTWSVLEPSGWRAPLVEREWAWGTQDCWGLVRDAYHQYAGIDLPDYEREWGFWDRGEDLIDGQFASAGFVLMPPGSAWQHLDVAGMQMRSRVINHLGVFLKDGPYSDVLLHQMAERPSRREVFGGFYQNAVVRQYRHAKFAAVAP